MTLDSNLIGFHTGHVEEIARQLGTDRELTLAVFCLQMAYLELVGVLAIRKDRQPAEHVAYAR